MFLRIAIVDKHVFFRRIIRFVLKLQPDVSVVAEAGNGIAEIQMVGNSRPDLVLTDIQLPVIDGLEVTRFITSKFPDTKVVVLSQFVDDSTRAIAIEAGAAHLLPKDGQFQSMVEIVRSFHQPTATVH